MKKLLIILGGIALLVGVVCTVVAMQPSEYEFSRSTEVGAPAEVVFAEINSLKRFTEWDPWTKRDPSIELSFEGPEQGVGARYSWSGNDQVGTGTMEIVRSEPNRLVVEKLTFIEPFEDQSAVEFRLEPASAGTKVTWAMSGENNFMAKAFGLFMDMEGMINADFDEGLASLKARVEQASAAAKL